MASADADDDDDGDDGDDDDGEAHEHAVHRMKIQKNNLPCFCLLFSFFLCLMYDLTLLCFQGKACASCGDGALNV